jgi:hypothetical protein
MTQRNQADQDVGAGEAFVKCIEKTGLPGFAFSGQGEIGAWLSQRRLLKKKTAKTCTSEDQKLAAGCRMTRNREPKCKSRKKL